MTASELFCKNFDPYYATATGFKGEITLWMSVAALALVLIPGLFVDRFWCKYICPLGAICNSLKFWVWMAVLVGVWWILDLLGLQLPWVWLLGAMCLLGYLLEILCGRPKPQLLGVVSTTANAKATAVSARRTVLIILMSRHLKARSILLTAPFAASVSPPALLAPSVSA